MIIHKDSSWWILLDFDNRPRDHTVIVQLIGD